MLTCSELRSCSSKFQTLGTALPCDIVEVLGVSFATDRDAEDAIGRIVAPASIPASLLEYTLVTKRVFPGRSAIIRLTPTEVTNDESADSEALAALVRVVRPCISLFVSPAASVPLAAITETSSVAGSIDISALVPEGTPFGSEVVLYRVVVGDSQLDPCDSVARVCVGYNDEPSPEGPVYAAARDGDVDALMKALELGGSIREQTGSRSTPLHIAASRGHAAVLRVLIDAGIEVDARNENSCTALHWAARRSANVEIVKMLIAAGADVNAQDTMWGDTPLHDAADNGNDEIVGVLLQAGANTRLRNKAGKAPGEIRHMTF